MTKIRNQYNLMNRRERMTYTRHIIEDLKVLKHLPDLFNNVKIHQGQLRFIIKHVLPYTGVAAILVK